MKAARRDLSQNMFILIAGRTFNWLHDGKNVNGELILRENGT